jgi:tetratricopeptide (TPR) repeat protein
MLNSQRIHHWVGLAVFFLTLGVYVKTMAPTVSFWDCGEFIATAYTMSVPHPPGAPLYVLIGRVFTLFPFGEVAARINFMSALSSALAIWCVYLTTAALGRRALGGQSLKAFGDHRDIGVIAGAAVAALTLAFSYTQWYNASEAEVYGYSILFTCLGLWLIVYWEGTGHGQENDRWLFAIAYLFGLGGGLHMLCLLTIPSLLILAWFSDSRLQRLIVQLLGLGLIGFVAILVLGPGTSSNAVMGLGILGLLYYLYGQDRRLFYLLLGVVGLFAFGYSTYAALYIRSGLNPVIDQNDPETFKAFMAFINREQYGTDSMLTTMLNARADRAYQFWDQQMKYFFQQFPFPLLERTVTFRKATGDIPQPILISLIPYGLGLWGFFWHAQRDWRRFAAIFAMFLIMGFGLSMYLNMPDPQPRERHYVFGGMYLAFSLWIGLGWVAIIEAIREKLAQFSSSLIAIIAVAGLLLPAGVFAKLYHIEDRTGDYVAYDYAYNMLAGCEQDAVIFTNGDNDTFPLWFLQEVEGIRKDVRVVNLSLLNTGWYIKQLRDREPKIDIRFDDTLIDSVLTDTQLVDLYRRLWEPKIPPEFKNIGLDIEVKTLEGHDLLRVQDIMVIKILGWNEWKKPMHFAITIPASNRVGLDPFLSMVGMTMKVMPQRNDGSDPEALRHNLMHEYRFRGLNDPEVHKDENTTRLLGNYRACVLQLALHYKEQGDSDEMVKLMRWAEENIYMSWEGYYTAADHLSTAGEHEIAAEYLHKSTDEFIKLYGTDPVATYDNIVSLAGVLLNEPYSAFDRAEAIYRQAIVLEPNRWEGHYELAATLQAIGDIPGALTVVRQYKIQYGERPEMLEAEQILLSASERPAATDSAALP